MAKKRLRRVPPGYRVKFVAFVTNKAGRRIYARWFGYAAFPIIVPIE